MTGKKLFTWEENDNNYFKKNLNKKIPDYMLPNVYIRIHEFPYNANGKIDRTELKKTYINQNA